MDQQPTAFVSECARVKPRLLVFDDDVEQLHSYCSRLSTKYDVEGVLVSDCNATDAILKAAICKGSWADAAKAFRLHDASVFDCVRHMVSSHDELRNLLKERHPDFVLSDYQMRRIQGPISGIDVMHAVAELLPDAGRAIHTGAGCANPTIKVRDLSDYDHEDRIELVKAMHVDGFKTFPKSPYHKNFNPGPIEAYFAAAHSPMPD